MTLAYVCPPFRYDRAYSKKMGQYVEEYMKGLIKQGYIRQFFNIEFWAAENKQQPGDFEFKFCEINPRCAHTFHFLYETSSGHNLYRSVFELVLNNKIPSTTPWQKWEAG